MTLILIDFICVYIFTCHLTIIMCVHRLAESKTLDVDDFLDRCEYEAPNKMISYNPGNLKLLQLNIRGLNSKIPDLCNLMKTCIQPEAILLSETWLKTHSPTPILPGYKLERKDRTCKKGDLWGLYFHPEQLYIQKTIRPRDRRQRMSGILLCRDKN